MGCYLTRGNLFHGLLFDQGRSLVAMHYGAKIRFLHVSYLDLQVNYIYEVELQQKTLKRFTDLVSYFFYMNIQLQAN